MPTDSEIIAFVQRLESWSVDEIPSHCMEMSPGKDSWSLYRLMGQDVTKLMATDTILQLPGKVALELFQDICHWKTFSSHGKILSPFFTQHFLPFKMAAWGGEGSVSLKLNVFTAGQLKCFCCVLFPVSKTSSCNWVGREWKFNF